MRAILHYPWLRSAVIAFGVLGIGVTLSFAGFASIRSNVDARSQAEFDNRVQHAVQVLQERLVRAEHTVLNTHNLFDVADVTAEEFTHAAEHHMSLPGLGALLYGEKVADQSGELHYPIRFLEQMPTQGFQDSFDLGSYPAARRAIEKARDTSSIVATEPMADVLEPGSSPGFFLVLPIYEVQASNGLSENRPSFAGVVAGYFNVDDLVAGLSGLGSDFEVAIHQVETGNDKEGTASPFYTSAGEPFDEALTSMTELHVGDRLWRLEAVQPQGAEPTNWQPGVVLFSGIIISLAISFGTFTAMTSRDRASTVAARATTDLRKQARQLREARDRAMEADKSKTRFLANMSHELRTPLNAVIGLSSVLSNETFGPLNEKQGDYVSNIASSGDHLLQLINDLLDLARIEAGQERWQIEDVSIREAIFEAVGTVATQAEESDVEILSENIPKDVYALADRRKLKQVLINLLSNAVKFSKRGGTVGIDVSSNAKFASITIWDSGIGIPHDELDKIFEPFHQVDDTLARSAQGTGLGLALSKTLVERHGGSVEVDSVEGHGSTFGISWPIGSPPQEPRSRDELQHSRPPEGLRVLVAEDSIINRQLMVDLLTTAGCTAIEAASGEEALRLAWDTKPDLILLDIQLPAIDGLTVASMLKSEPALAAIPILAVTAQALPEERQQILAGGCDGYLSKPFTQAEFLSTVATVVGQPAAV